MSESDSNVPNTTSATQEGTSDSSQAGISNIHEKLDTSNMLQSEALDRDYSNVEEKLGLSSDERSDVLQSLPDEFNKTQCAQEDVSHSQGQLEGECVSDTDESSQSNTPTLLGGDTKKTSAPDDRPKVSRSLLDWVNPVRNLQKDLSNLASRSDVSKAVIDLVDATQHLQEDPSNVESINNLIDRLKHLLLQERQNYAFMRQNSESRKKLESLYNLIQYLESQVQRLQRAAQRRGLRYYLANISNKVRGNEVGRIGQSMESELQSWLDQQSVREVAAIISKGSDEEEQVHAISSFQSVIQKGYNSLLQDTILSAGLVEKLAGLLAPGAASWRVAKEAAFALCALIDFNKDIFVSLVLMAKMVENILRLMNLEPDDHVLILVSIMRNMLSAGHTIAVDEIYAHNGVSKLVELLDHESQALQLAAVDCIFELAYYGRVEVVDTLFKLEVVKKLALLQQKNTTEGELDVGPDCDKQYSQQEGHLLDVAGNWLPQVISTRLQEDGKDVKKNPFADVVTKFALHLSIGTGLRKREKRALKQEFLRQIREVLEDDTEVANITAEVLWAP